MPPDPKVSIIILCYNRLDCTIACWQGLRNTLPPRIRAEVIFVNNASNDETGGFLRGLEAEARVLWNAENLGFAKGCNQGARAASGEFLLFLNNDTVPLAGWLEPMLDLLADGATGIVGSKLLYPDRRVQHAGVVVREFRPSNSRLVPHHIYNLDHEEAPWVSRSREFQCVTGACMLLRRDEFLAAGGFDERYLNGYEDIDLCFRFRELGRKVIYCAESVLLHHESASEGRHCHNEKNAALLQERWNGKIQPDERKIYESDGRQGVFEMNFQLAEMESYIGKIERHDFACRHAAGESWVGTLTRRWQRWLGIATLRDDLAAVRSALFRAHRAMLSASRSIEEQDRDLQNALYGGGDRRP